MSAPFDPRLARAVAGVRASLWWIAAFGVLTLLAGAGILAAVVTGSNKENLIPGIVFSGLFFVPGLWLIRKLILGPAHNKAIALMTTNRENLWGYDLIYVSVNSGPTKPRILLYRKDGSSEELFLERGEENDVLAYLSEFSKRLETRA